MPYTETQPKPEPEPDPEPEPEPDPPILIGPDDNDQSKKRQNGELKELFKLYAPLLQKHFLLQSMQPVDDEPQWPPWTAQGRADKLR